MDYKTHTFPTPSQTLQTLSMSASSCSGLNQSMAINPSTPGSTAATSSSTPGARSIIACEPVAPGDPGARQSRIYLCVVGDLWHYGHANLCATARRKFGGDNPWIIVGVCSDADVSGYKRVPILTAEERGRNAACCRFVDEVVVNCPFVLTEEFMDEMRIDYVVHGDDHSAASAKKYYSVALARDAYRTVPYTHGVSTSEILNRVHSRSDPAARQNPHGH